MLQIFHGTNPIPPFAGIGNSFWLLDNAPLWGSFREFLGACRLPALVFESVCLDPSEDQGRVPEPQQRHAQVWRLRKKKWSAVKCLVGQLQILSQKANIPSLIAGSASPNLQAGSNCPSLLLVVHSPGCCLRAQPVVRDPTCLMVDLPSGCHQKGTHGFQPNESTEAL